jgi:DNA polymerase elongation subunit (family B)
MILRGSSLAEVEELIFKEIDKIKSPTDYEYLALPVRIGKIKYEADLPKMRGLEYAKKLLGVFFKPGMKILMLYIVEADSDALCFERNSDLVDKGVKIDKEKMIERNILLPLSSILEIWKGEKYVDELKSKIKNNLTGQQTLW